MADNQTNPLAKTEAKSTSVSNQRHPFEELRREVDRLFEDFTRGSWLRPFRPSEVKDLFSMPAPAVDIVENDKTFKLTAELPGLNEKQIDVSVKNGAIVIKGEKQEEKEENSEGYHLRERQFGSFERVFAIPEGADASKAAATFKSGVLTVVLPKTEAASKPATKVEIKVT